MTKERCLTCLFWSLTVLAVVLIAAGITDYFVDFSSKLFSNEPLVIVDGPAKAVGEVKVGEAFETVFRFKNRMDQPIQIIGNNGS